MTDGVDVDRVADMAERLGLVTPDMQGPDEESEDAEVIVLIHIRGGLLSDVGCRRRDIGRLRVVVVDEDVPEGDGERSTWTETPSAIEDWPTGPSDPLFRARTELPRDLIERLGMPEPTTRPTEDDRVPPCPTETPGEE